MQQTEYFVGKNGNRHKSFQQQRNFFVAELGIAQMLYLVARCAPTNDITNYNNKGTFYGKRIKFPQTIIFSGEFVIRILLQNFTIFNIILAKAKKINYKCLQLAFHNKNLVTIHNLARKVSIPIYQSNKSKIKYNIM